jgi:hypothetical protein
MANWPLDSRVEPTIWPVPQLIMPPSHFIAGLKQRSMMVATKRNGELVAEFKTQCPGFAPSAVIGAALTHAVVRITL